jgi:hypothetical protein
VVVFLVSLIALVAVACGDDEESDTGTGSTTGTGTGSVTGSATGIGAEPGVVQSPPAGATQVTVTLDEWQVRPDKTTVPAGAIYFLADNVGEDPHELVVVKTDLAPDDLPVEDGSVPEDDVDLIDEIEPFASGSKASAVFNLTAGKYVLFCNIAEVEDGELESHYELGMRTAFTVQ